MAQIIVKNYSDLNKFVLVDVGDINIQIPNITAELQIDEIKKIINQAVIECPNLKRINVLTYIDIAKRKLGLYSANVMGKLSTELQNRNCRFGIGYSGTVLQQKVIFTFHGKSQFIEMRNETKFLVYKDLEQPMNIRSLETHMTLMHFQSNQDLCCAEITPSDNVNVFGIRIEEPNIVSSEQIDNLSQDIIKWSVQYKRCLQYIYLKFNIEKSNRELFESFVETIASIESSINPAQILVEIIENKNSQTQFRKTWTQINTDKIYLFLNAKIIPNIESSEYKSYLADQAISYIEDDKDNGDLDNSEMATHPHFDKLKTAANELENVYKSEDKTYLEVSEKLEKIELILNEADEDLEKKARLILSVAQWLCLEFRKSFPDNPQYCEVLYNSLISISKRLKIIIWLKCDSVSQRKVGEFYFPLNTVKPLFTIKIDKKTNLKHSMSVKSVIELLDLSPNTSPKKRAIDIFVNRTGVCSERQMYCTVALTTGQLSKLEKKVPDMYANVIQNRYGCAVVKFRIQPYLNNESVKFFNLGTKQFYQECMQMVLVDSSPWKVFCECLRWSETIDTLQDKELDLEEIKEIKPITDFEWGLKYTKKYWTHPTFIFVNEITFPEFVPKSESQTESLPEFELEFEKHKCIETYDGRRKLCLDCNLYFNSGENVYVTQVDIINNQETPNVSVSISEYKTVPFNCSPEFGIFVFAMSLPVSNRQKFLDKVNEGRYIVKQLEQIQRHWENAPNFYYTDWSLPESLD